MRKPGFYLFVIIVLVFSGCGPDKKSPEYRLKQYLTALKNKKFEEAKTYCEQSAQQNLQCSLDMGNTDFGITDIRDIKCTIEKSSATCKFCCMDKESDPEFKLTKLKDEWLIVGVKETCPLYDSLETNSTNAE